MFAGNDYMYARKLGSEHRTSVTNVALKGMGSVPTYLQSELEGIEVGVVPKKNVKNRTQSTFPDKSTEVKLEPRFGARPRFMLP